MSAAAGATQTPMGSRDGDVNVKVFVVNYGFASDIG